MNHVPHSPGASDQDTLDLASIPGVRDHYDRTGEIPILVFRKARQIRSVLNPFPGVWKLASATETRSIIAGRNTFPTPLALEPGDELTITPLMSAIAPTGPRVQVPAELADDIGELEALEDLPEIPDDEPDLDEGPDDNDIDTALGAALGWHHSSHIGGAP